MADLQSRKPLLNPERRRRGIPVNLETQREILAMRDELGLRKYHFPFAPN